MASFATRREMADPSVGNRMWRNMVTLLSTGQRSAGSRGAG
jgi:hypothetical protein